MTRKLFSTSSVGVSSTQEVATCRDPCSESSTSTTSSKPPLQYPDPSWCSLLVYTPNSKLKLHVVPAAHGYAFTVRKSQHFRIIDLHGQQVCDFMAWKSPYLVPSSHIHVDLHGSNQFELNHSLSHLIKSPERLSQHFNKRPQPIHFSTSYTRYRLKSLACPEVGECLYTNTDEPMFTLVADTCRTHDLLFMACNPGFYKQQQPSPHTNLGSHSSENPALSQHRSCATNVAEAMRPHGMQHYSEVVDPFNIFQNTPYYTIKGKLNSSRAGDYVELQAEMDAVVAVSSCPYTGDGFNGGKVTEIGVLVEE